MIRTAMQSKTTIDRSKSVDNRATGCAWNKDRFNHTSNRFSIVVVLNKYAKQENLLGGIDIRNSLYLIFAV